MSSQECLVPPPTRSLPEAGPNYEFVTYTCEEEFSDQGDFELDGEIGVGPSQHGYGLDGFIEGIEAPWSYLHGGHHPVHLGDCLGDHLQYRVIHKLGTGGFGNVWLCRVLDREPSQYVAVKILMAHLSGDDRRELANVRHLQQLAKSDSTLERYCLLPLDDFKIHGPNGVHQCFVYPVAGPPLGEISNVVQNPHGYLRNLSRQAVEAMAALHRHGICHGDFRPANILLCLDGLNGMSEEEVLDCLGKPTVANVIAYADCDPHAAPPWYLVYPVEFRKSVNTQLATDQICVIDFGECFEASTPPLDGVGIPLPYSPPELVLEQNCGTASDIWALAATIFEIRIGEKLFSVFEDSTDAYLYSMVQQLGRLPEPWWSRWSDQWKHAKVAFEPKDQVKETILDDESVRRGTIRGLVGECVAHLISTSRRGRAWHEALPDEEKELLEDLLYKMTELDPDKRLSIEQVLRHAWFSYGVEDPQAAEADISQSLVRENIELVEGDKLQSPRSHRQEADVIDLGEALELDNPQPADIGMLRSAEADKRPSVGIQKTLPIKTSMPQSVGSAKHSWTPVNQSVSKIELNAARYRVFAISVWLRTTVARAFNYVLG